MSYIDEVQVGGTDYDLYAKALSGGAAIDGVDFDATGNVTHYAVCATAAGTAEKTATLGTNFTLSAGSRVEIKFTYGNTTASPTLNINSTGAKAIKAYGTTAAGSGAWVAGQIVQFEYDGTSWLLVGRVPVDTTLTESGQAADAAAVGGALFNSLSCAFTKKTASDYSWQLNKTVTSTGVLGVNNPTAVTQMFRVDGGNCVLNIANKTGMNGASTVLHVNQYIDNVWQSRTILDNGSSLVLDSATNGVRLTFGYTAASGNVETQEDVNQNFAALIISPVALAKHIFGGKSTTSNFAPSVTCWRAGLDGYSSTNPVSPVDMPQNSYGYGSGAAYAGFNNSTFTLNSADGYWFFKLNNITDAWTVSNVCAFFVIDTSDLTVYIGKSADNGATVTWSELCGDVENNYNYTVYNNAYSVTATPTITTDTNNYLASTGDTTDRTSDIAALLASTGVCRLGPGNFYVKNLQLPRNALLSGCGNNTVLIYDSNDAGSAVKMEYYTSIENVMIQQGTTPVTPSTVDVGNVHGILFEGDADASTPTFTPRFVKISNVYIKYFSGGGITCHNTGPNVRSGLQAVNCFITNCGAGINISYNSEYHEFTNIKCYRCGIGLVNNGGNNKFVGCDFSQNVQGLLMDNSNGQSPNNGHGSIVGCTFNHNNDNNGVAVELIGITPGFIFSACQIFYGTIIITNCKGITFGDLNAGTIGTITISGGGLINFHDASFNTAPTITITNNSNVHFTDCYTRDGAAVSA